MSLSVRIFVHPIKQNKLAAKITLPCLYEVCSKLANVLNISEDP